jgi:hypothetical protein
MCLTSHRVCHHDIHVDNYVTIRKLLYNLQLLSIISQTGDAICTAAVVA